MSSAERAAYNSLSAKLCRQARNNGHDHPHKFEAGPDPVSAGCLPRCRVCKTTIKAPWHTNEHKRSRRPVVSQAPVAAGQRSASPAAATDGEHVVVACPTCAGKGTVVLAVADVQRLALRARA